MKHKKKLHKLTEKYKQKLSDVGKRIEQCCSNPKPRNYITEMFEPYTLCGNCGKDIL